MKHRTRKHYFHLLAIVMFLIFQAALSPAQAQYRLRGVGDNTQNQFGRGGSAPYSTPVVANNLTGVISVAAGDNHHLSLKADGTVWASGNDSSGELGRKYGMRTTPHMFVIDKNGILAYQGAIDNRPSPEGDPRTARNYVREAIGKLMAGEKVQVTQTRPYGCGVKYGS